MNTFQCYNCRNVINVGAVQCPYCKHNPYQPATADTGVRYDQVAYTNDSPIGLLLLIAFGVFIGFFVTWWVGVPISIVGIWHFFKNVS